MTATGALDRHIRMMGCQRNKAVTSLLYHHLVVLDHHAADSLPLAMLAECLALNDARLAFAASDSPVRGGEPDTPC